MRCPWCELDNKSESKFCAGCGAALVIACPSCGASNGARDRFCGGCGITLAVIDDSAMIVIPAGEFWMGADHAHDSYSLTPPRRVHLDAYQIDKYPVTNARWKRFIDAGGYAERRWWSREGWRWKEDLAVVQPRHWNEPEYDDPEQPVVGVSWWEAEAFCRSVGKRLPTEAEWEKAARGCDGREYPWGDRWELNEVGVWNRLAERLPRVGSNRAVMSPYGFSDVGLVCEWVADSFEGQGRVLRSHQLPLDRPNYWPKDRYPNYAKELYPKDLQNGLRTTKRYWAPPGDNSDIGFRCAGGLSHAGGS